MAEGSRITIVVAARRSGLSPRSVRCSIRRGLVDGRLTEAELAKLRRIRRLMELGINMAGVQVVLNMRSQIEELQSELAHLKAEPTDEG